jgi:hypothetical protein
MYKIYQYNNDKNNNDKNDTNCKNTIKFEQQFEQQFNHKINNNNNNNSDNTRNIALNNQINQQLQNHYENNYRNNRNNQLQHSQYEELVNDITKMHIIPPKCPMTPQSFTDFFSDNSELKRAAPYQLLYKKHPKDDKINTKIEYSNFYSDWKKDAIDYTDKKQTAQYLDYKDNSTKNVNTLYGSNRNNIDNEVNADIIDKTDNMYKNVKIYEETKNHKGFAVPMRSNGSNKLETLYNDCLNKPTFEYKRFGYDMLSNHKNNNPNPNHLVDNPLYNNNLTYESNSLYEEYLNDRIKNASNIYDIVFEDMYIMGYVPEENTNNS